MGEKCISEETLVCLKRYWGYTQFRSWQEDTIFAILDGRDSLTVLPTGGGKSLCFQLPALLKDMAALKPLTHEDFSAVFGVGEHKLKIYSESFISVIRQYVTSQRETNKHILNVN